MRDAGKVGFLAGVCQRSTPLGVPIDLLAEFGRFDRERVDAAKQRSLLVAAGCRVREDEQNEEQRGGFGDQQCGAPSTARGPRICEELSVAYKAGDWNPRSAECKDQARQPVVLRAQTRERNGGPVKRNDEPEGEDQRGRGEEQADTRRPRCAHSATARVSAWSMSQRMSSILSIPTDIRTMSDVTPALT